MMERRAFLHGVGALGCGAMFDEFGSTSNYATLQRINLVFHGPFAFIVDTTIKAVRVVTPKNADHAFCWYGKSFAPMKPLPSANDFTLDPTGLNVGGSPPSPPAYSIVIKAGDCSFTVDKAGTMPTSEGSDFAIRLQLPYPSTPPTALRPAKNNTPPGQGSLKFLGLNADKIAAPQFPLVYAFSYTVNTPDSVIFHSNDNSLTWKPASENPGAAYANLHIFAEPPCGVDTSHAAPVFSDLMGLIHENVAQIICRPFPPGKPPGLPTRTGAGVGDISDDETMSLEERCRQLGLCPPAAGLSAGVRIVNCMGFFVI